MNKLKWILGTILFVSWASSLGCASTQPCDPIVVEVPVAVAAPGLPVPEVPEWQSPTADPSDVRAYVRALVHDILNAWAWGTEMKHTIEAYNEAQDETPGHN